MKRWICFISCCLVSIAALANMSGWKVIGKVIEKSNHKPIEYVTIALRNGNGKLVSGTITDSLGTFKMNGIADGNYQITYSYIGYGDINHCLIVKGNTDCGIVSLNNSTATSLGEVIVKGRQRALIQRLDKKVYNVDQDIMSTSESIGELLQHIPSVDMDIDGNISVRGNQNVTILVNGRLSTLFNGKSKGDALQQLSASNIERIEVITNPSAAYRPDGTSGIINIILKKNARKGLNGSLYSNIGNKDRFNAGTNLSLGTDKWSILGGYAFRQDRYDRTTTDNRDSKDGQVSQNTIGTGHPKSHTFNLGGSLKVTPEDAINFSGNYEYRRFLRTEDVESNTQSLSGVETENYSRLRNADARENMYEGNAAYAHKYGNDNQWGIDYAYSSQTENEMNDYQTSRTLRETVYSKNNEKVWNGNYLNTAKLYWQFHPWQGGKLSSGYELEHLKTEQDYHVGDWNGSNYIPDASNSSDFTYWRTVHSFYTTIDIQSGKWNMTAGIRGEYDHQRSLLAKTDSFIRKNEFSLYPTFHSSWQLTGHQELQLNYSLRVNRPAGEDMDPYAEHINPLSMQTGNPHLKPEKIHSLETGWMWHNDVNSTLTTTLYYRYTLNPITNISYMNKDTLITTKENMQNSQDAGLEVIWSWQPLHWLSLNINGNGFYQQINASKLGYGSKRSTWAWSSLMNADITPLNHLTIQFNTRYNSPQLIPQGHLNGNYIFNMGIRYEYPKTGLSIIASISDLFNTFHKSYTLNTDDLRQKVEKRRNPRIVYIGLTYNFGLGTKKSQEIKYDDKL